VRNPAASGSPPCRRDRPGTAVTHSMPRILRAPAAPPVPAGCLSVDLFVTPLPLTLRADRAPYRPPVQNGPGRRAASAACVAPDPEVPDSYGVVIEGWVLTAYEALNFATLPLLMRPRQLALDAISVVLVPGRTRFPVLFS
jgi:hypothetical protein